MRDVRVRALCISKVKKSRACPPLTKARPIALELEKRDMSGILRRPSLKFVGINTFAQLQCNLTNVFEGGPPYLIAPYWFSSGQARHFKNFKATLKIHRINSFVKLRRYLTNVFERGGAPLLNRSLSGCPFRTRNFKFRRNELNEGISQRILRRP